MLRLAVYDGNIDEIMNVFSNRKGEVSKEIQDTVTDILQEIASDKEKAVYKYAKQFDGYQINNNKDLVVSKEEMETGLKEIDEDYFRILKRAKQQIIDFHEKQLDKSWTMTKSNGVIMGQMVTPLQRVGLYVPGGTATYPSTVLMNAIPAMIAGVEELVIITPVKEDGKVNPVILAAASICNIKTIYKVGGVQGIGALAYGTNDIKKVDKIVGPGNAYVATAKKLCYGLVDIDMIAGPSEVLIIADKNANPRYVAADLLSQAEHDALASSILVSDSLALIEEVNIELEKQLGFLERQDIARESIVNYGCAILVNTIQEAFDVSNQLAPEHLEILLPDPMNSLPFIKNAGSIFLGEYTPEPLGDYMSGTNHVLPTGSTAKFYSALGVYDFVKYSSYSYYPKLALEDLKDDVIKFAKSEGLQAHARSIEVRFEKGDNSCE